MKPIQGGQDYGLAPSRGPGDRLHRSGRALVLAAASLSLAPAPAFAHNAFGDLGPFYASLLHPLADPLQGALLIGTAAFLAGRRLSVARLALPIFAAIAALAASALVAGTASAAPPILAASAALLVGFAAMLPAASVPRSAALALVAAAGALTGLAPDAPPGSENLQPLLGTILGIAGLTTLAWFVLDTAARRLTPIVPRVAGSWVAAVGILVVAFVV